MNAVQARQAPAQPAPGSPGKAVLLALDGRCLDRLALPLALQHCRRGGHRLDILLTQPPRAATTLLGGFLTELERQGIDYRLTSSERDLEQELRSHLHRFRYISVVLLDCLAHWDGEDNPFLEGLRSQGYRVISLEHHRQDGRATRTTLLDAGSTGTG
ncbi:MAG: hypothetical protein AB1899_08245 [Pseudomonadota bacterium]